MLNHLCNLGYGRAIQTAIRFAARDDYGLLVTYDADGQHRPEDVVALLSAFHEHECDVLIGSRLCQAQRNITLPGRDASA